MRSPIVLVTSCNRPLGEHAFHMAGRKYVDGVRLAGALPLIAPPVPVDQLDDLLDSADGILLTGSVSNVHPSAFGEKVHNEALPLDRDRDGWTLPLIPKALARGIPLLAICRGAQEANVALGGSLHQAVQEVAGLNDHRAPAGQPAEVQYGLAHRVDVVPGGLLSQIVGRADFEVNSVHGQGVNRLADGLRVEALSPDGVVEAFSMPSTQGFNLCVQWHPEWRAESNPISVEIFKAFGKAVRQYQELRHRESATA